MSQSLSEPGPVPRAPTDQRSGFSIPNDWLSGGTAVIDQGRGQVQLTDPLRDRLGLGPGAEFPEEVFWAALFGIDPTWKAVIAPVLAGSQWCNRLELSSSQGESTAWFELELVRAQEVLFVRLNSIVPPLSQLEEDGAEEHAQSSGAALAVRLVRAEGQLRNLMQRWPGVIFSQRSDLSFHGVSPRIEGLTGVAVEEFKRFPQRFWAIIHEGDVEELQQQIRQAANSAGPITTVFRVRHTKTGRVSYILEHREGVRTRNGLLLGFEGAWLDVTRQTIAEKRLTTAAWKETLSVLTMGLAHDFSNIMAGIHSLSETYQAQVGPDHPFHEGLALIKRNSLQASQLIQRMLQLHRGKLGERTYHNLNDLTAEVLELVRKIIPRHIQVEVTLSAQELPVYADAVEFRQVLINLALNAMEAMPQGGRLRFEVLRHENYPALRHVEGNLPRLPSVCVTVADQGCGIPPEHMVTIFDPFFTTKSQEKGSGLGLYNARLFAEKHRGAISVESTLHKGTTFGLWLPEADFTEAERAESVESGKRHTLLIYGPATPALNSTADFFRQSGYSVVMASPPQKEPELLRGQGYTVSGVLVLPNGPNPIYRELIQMVRGVNPALKIVARPLGCNQDEIDSALLSAADLVLPAELPQAEVLSRIQAHFHSSS